MLKMSFGGLLCAAFVSARLGLPLSLPSLYRHKKIIPLPMAAIRQGTGDRGHARAAMLASLGAANQACNVLPCDSGDAGHVPAPRYFAQIRLVACVPAILPLRSGLLIRFLHSHGKSLKSA